MEDKDELVREFRRVILAELDLNQAVAFGDLLLKHLPVGAGEKEVIAEALSLAAVVAYARLFTRSKDPAIAHSHLGAEYVSGWTPEDVALHEWLLKMRHTELAHSDTEAHDLIIDNSGEFAVPVSRRTGMALTDAQAKGLLHLASLVRARLLDRHVALWSLLPKGQI